MLKTFTAKFEGMRKEQEFVVYPPSASKPDVITIQSDRAIASFNTETGSGRIYKGASPYFAQLSMMSKPFTCPQEVIKQALACVPETNADGTITLTI